MIIELIDKKKIPINESYMYISAARTLGYFVETIIVEQAKLSTVEDVKNRKYTGGICEISIYKESEEVNEK